MRTIYCIQAGEGGPIKIGIATDVADRLNRMTIDNHEELKVLATTPGDWMLESMLHRILWRHHLRGEWFRPTPVVLSMVNAIKAGTVEIEIENLQIYNTERMAEIEAAGLEIASEVRTAAERLLAEQGPELVNKIRHFRLMLRDGNAPLTSVLKMAVDWELDELLRKIVRAA